VYGNTAGDISGTKMQYLVAAIPGIERDAAVAQDHFMELPDIKLTA
jgi:hypothetical protein